MLSSERRKTTVVTGVLLSVLGLCAETYTQQVQRSNLPILQPVVRVLGEVPPSALPVDNVSLSPNGRFIVYTTRSDVRIFNTGTREQSVLLAGVVHTLTWGPKGDVIVFQTHPNSRLRFQGTPLPEDAALWTIRIDSDNGRALESPKLAAKVSVNHAPFLSPDQQTIAFVQWWGGFVTSLCVVPAGGGVPRILTSAIEITSIEWDATGSALFYKAFVDSSSSTRQRFRVSLSGGSPSLVEEQGTNESGWPLRNAATGKTVAQMAIPTDVEITDWRGVNLAEQSGLQSVAGIREVQPRGLRIVSLADGKSRDLLDAAVEVDSPVWFEDGSNRIAVIVRKNGELSLLTQRTDGSDLRTYPFSNPPLFGGAARSLAQMRVSPDARYAAFKSDRKLELMDLASGRQRTLITAGRDGRSPNGNAIGPLAWSNDSKSIFYVSGVSTPDLAVHEVTLSGVDKTIRLLPTFVYGQPPVTFPSLRQPKFVEFAGARNSLGNGAVTLVPLSGGPPQVVFPELAIGGPLSPNGRTLAVQKAAPNGQNGLMISLASIDGSSTTDLNLPFIALPGVQWHPDGQRLLVFGREKPGAAASIYSVPVNGMPPSIVASWEAAREPTLAVSPDGRFIAATVARAPSATFVKLDFDVPKDLSPNRTK